MYQPFMSNIYNHNRYILDVRLNKDEYWDFHLSVNGDSLGSHSEGLVEKCLISYIDINDPNCVSFDKLMGKTKYIWEKSKNVGFTLKNIGYTGVDNGLISYEKDRISNEKFLHIFTKSERTFDINDNILQLYRVNGNNQIFSYDVSFEEVNDQLMLALRGGFYQGFWKTTCDEYQVLPDYLDDTLCFDMVLSPRDWQINEYTLNSKYPENKGMFLYLGTRAENKWLKYFNDDYEGIDCGNSAFGDDYVNSKYLDSNGLNDDYLKPYKDVYTDEEYVSSEYFDTECPFCNGKTKMTYFADGYIKGDYYDEDSIPVCSLYVTNEYIKSEKPIDVNMDIKTYEGLSFNQPNMVEYVTNNKFLLFNRTEDGFTTRTWDGEDDTFVITDIKIPSHENLFLIANHTKDGYTVDELNKLKKEWSKSYSPLKDLYRNAIGFQITDEGKIGYKYLVQDCDKENEYRIESQFTDANVIKKDEWYNVVVKLIPMSNGRDTSANNKMRIAIYVNGKVVLMSKMLPILNLRQLDDLYMKQEGVPYNLSVGGGTQGLADVVYLNFRETPKMVYPLEREFAGTFIGYIKSFKIYNCALTLQEIQQNYNFECVLLQRKDIYN